MGCTPAPACEAALREATERWPGRDRASDGICASRKHTTQNPDSDHEPHVVIQGKGYATAFDLTDDKANGCDARWFAEQLRVRRDDRVKYVIANRRMFSSYSTRTRPAWEWGTYKGLNPHDTHTHVSILPRAVFVTRSWFEEDELSEAEVRELKQFIESTVRREVDELETHLRELDAKRGKEWAIKSLAVQLGVSVEEARERINAVK